MRTRHTRFFRNRPAVTASAYSAGNVVGGIQSFGPLDQCFGRGLLKQVAISDRANQKAAMTLLFFQDNPAGGSYADKAAPTFADADDLLFLGKVEVATGDYTTVGAKAVATKECLLGIRSNDDLTRKVYVVAITSGTPTYVAVTDVQFILCVQMDQ